MKQIRYILKTIGSSILALCMGSFAQAAVIDFEGLGLAEGAPVTAIPGAPELSINGGNLVIPGSPRTAFNANSSGSGSGSLDDANTGNTLTSSTVNGTVIFTFSINIKDLQFFAIDVESSASGTETFEARVYDAANNLLSTVMVTGGDPGTGDGILTLIDFSTGFSGTESIRRLEFQGVAVPRAGNPGYAVDNFSYSVVPVPAAVWLFSSGLIGLIGIARRRKVN